MSRLILCEFPFMVACTYVWCSSTGDWNDSADCHWQKSCETHLMIVFPPTPTRCILTIFLLGIFSEIKHVRGWIMRLWPRKKLLNKMSMRFFWTKISPNESLCTAYLIHTILYCLGESVIHILVLFTNGVVFGVAEMQFVGNYKLSTY